MKKILIAFFLTISSCNNRAAMVKMAKKQLENIQNKTQNIINFALNSDIVGKMLDLSDSKDTIENLLSSS